jgi:hypothetical protein
MVGHCGIADNTAVSDGVHLLVPFAACPAAACAEAIRGLQLPHLQRLLARLGPPETAPGTTDSFSMPHERVLARAHGLEPVDGLIPLAALEIEREGRAAGDAAWAWITPAHLRVGRDHIQMAHPGSLALDEAHSRALLDAMHPYFAEDGLTLEYREPLRWLASGDLFRRLPGASLDRVIGRTVDAWMPQGDPGRPLRRLQQEMQMLLYTLPLTDQRQLAGLLPVNSFWVSGNGALPAGAGGREPAGLQVTPALREPALAEDWPAWAAAWQALDAGDCARLLADAEQGHDVRITLCGEAGARSWRTEGASTWRRLGQALAKPSVSKLLEGL